MLTSVSKRPKGSQGQRGQSGVSMASSSCTITKGSAPVPECTHCGRRHRGECRLLSEGCFRCGSMDHFLRDYPQRGAPTALPLTERFALAAQRGRRSTRPKVMGTPHRPTSETIEWPEARVAPHVYVMA